jgi:hypothetical protein
MNVKEAVELYLLGNLDNTEPTQRWHKQKLSVFADW